MKVNLKNFLQILITIGLALVIAVILVKSKPGIQHTADEMPKRAVQVITAREIPFSTQITAYGIVEPAITLNSTAEVSGKISFVHPDLKAGSTIPADTVVIRIESEDYDVSLKQTEADLNASRASLKELEVEEASAQRALKLAQKNLEVGEAEYARISKVYEQRVVTKSALDAEEQKVIALRQSLEDLQGRIDSFESRRQSINSQIARAEQAVKNSETILARTEITLPFNARIGTVNVDKGEFVAVGSLLFEAVDLNGVEINAQLSIDSMRKLVSHLADSDGAKERIIQSSGRINDALRLNTRVRLVNGMPMATWDARVLRISDSIDATRQTLGIVVGVDNPYDKIIPGKRPPLIKGMYTAVDIIAPAQPALVVPRKAVHQGRIYIASSDNRLEIRPVDVKLIQGDLLVIQSGITAGEKVIITDLIPVIDGMPLQVTEANEFEAEMRRRAIGDDAGM